MSATDVRLARIRAMVAALCSPECAGRRAGSREGVAARGIIARELETLGLEPAGSDGYLQAVPKLNGANLLAKIPGHGPYAARTLMVAAHYDHLGRLPDGLAYWGADDNAAAVAVLLDVAALLARDSRRVGRQVLICAFDGEEPPHFQTRAMGSVYFTEHPTVPLESIDMMLCMDLVGHAVGSAHHPQPVRSSLFVLGAERSPGTGRLVEEVGRTTGGVTVRRLGGDVIPAMSDYYAFEQRQVPFLFLTCGRWEHYHRPTDTPEKLDTLKILHTADYLGELVIELSQRAMDRVPFLRDGRDDLASLASIRGVAEQLVRVETRASRVLSVLADLEGRMDQGLGLRGSDRQTLSMLVMQLEDMLMG